MGKKDGKRKGEEAADEEVKVKKQKMEVSCFGKRFRELPSAAASDAGSLEETAVKCLAWCVLSSLGL